jgi:hypothetical protein
VTTDSVSVITDSVSVINDSVSVINDSVSVINDSVSVINDINTYTHAISDRACAIFLIISFLNGLLINRKTIGFLPRRAAANRKIDNLAPQGSS